MHHNLDIHPIPENVIYINELQFQNPDIYETQADYDKALSGKAVSQGGVLPDDNVRVYVPMDLSFESILRRLHELYFSLGSPNENNEFEYFSGMRKVVSQLEIYDQVWVARDMAHAIQKEAGGVFHSQRGIALARRIVEYLSEDEGCAECFPFNFINELTQEFLNLFKTSEL